MEGDKLRPSIQRHSGTVAHGFIVGGGYQGLTAELDAAAVEAAELLLGAYGKEVEIRFNSDRRSGGAFLKDSLPGLSGSCSVGINVGLETAITDEERLMLPLAYLRKLQGTRPAHLRYHAVAVPSMLADSPLRDRGQSWENLEIHRCETLSAALEWLVQNVDVTRLPE